ncbi:hypothetical protein G3M48_005416 [Beauveria asiatica]|uniref:AMP-dependent synthetase/ligase domain-containing protein n=1 Tax=Beauveria asiatica TaxID=1069075 RepID=A0AAW0RS72_9HYPO
MPPSTTLTSAFFAQASSSSSVVAVIEANGATEYHALASRAKSFAVQLTKILTRDTKRVVLVCTRGVDAIAVLLGTMSCGVQCIPILPESPVTAAYLGSLCGSLGTQYVACTPHAEIPAGVKDICVIRLQPILQGRERAKAWLDKARPDGDAIGLFRPGKSKPNHVAETLGAQLMTDAAQRNLGIESGCRVLVLGTLLDMSSFRPDRFPRLRTVAAGPGQLSTNLTHRWIQANVCVWSLMQAQDKYHVSMRRCQAVERPFFQPQTEHDMVQRLGDCAAANHVLALQDGVWYVETLDIHGTLHSFIVPEDLDMNKLKSNLVTRQPQLAGRVRLHARARLPVRADGTLDISSLKGEVACLEGLAGPAVARDATGTWFRLLRAVPAASIVVMLVNVGQLPIAIRQTKSIYSLAAGNMSMAMLSQQDALISLMYLLLRPCMSDGAVARFLPLWVKEQMASVFCDGTTVHTTLAAWAIFWLLWFSVTQIVSRRASSDSDSDSASASSFVMAVATWTLLVACISLGLASIPLLRRLPSQNRVLRLVHRSGSLAVWLMALALAVMQQAVAREQGAMASGLRIAGTVDVWLLAAPLVSLGVPWLTLRRVTAHRKWSATDREGWEISGRQLVSGARRWMTVSSPLSGNWRCAVAVASASRSGCNAWIAIVGVGRPEAHSCQSRSQLQSLPGQDGFQRTIWIQQLPVFRVLSATRFFQSVIVLAIGKGILAVAGKTPRFVIWSAAKQDFDNLDKKLDTDQIRKVPYTTSHQELSRVVVEEAKRGGAEAIFVIGSVATVAEVVRRLRIISSLSVYLETYN